MRNTARTLGLSIAALADKMGFTERELHYWMESPNQCTKVWKIALDRIENITLSDQHLNPDARF